MVDARTEEEFQGKFFCSRIPIDMRCEYLEDFDVSGVDVIDERGCGISTVKKKLYSRLDPMLVLDRDAFGITLVRKSNHALIAIEGIKSGSPFLHYAHLTANLPGDGSSTTHYLGVEPGTVSWVTDRLIELDGKTETWKVSREKAQKMIDRIDWEIMKQSEGEIPVYYGACGSDSMFAPPRFAKALGWQYLKKGHIPPDRQCVVPAQILGDGSTQVRPDNCLSWARRMLAIAEVEAATGLLDMLWATPRRHIPTIPGKTEPGMGFTDICVVT